jgi:hypothetical protein
LHVELALIQICNIGAEKKNLDLNPSKPDNKPEENPVQNSYKQTVNKPTPVINPVTNDVRSISNNIPSFSIKNALKNEHVQSSNTSFKKQEYEIQDKLDIALTQEDKSFTQKELILAWEKHAMLFKDNEPRMYNTLSTQTPVLKNNTEIELYMNNQLQEEEFQRIKPSLIVFLKNELRNNKITILTSLAQPDDDNKKFYTDKEKFDHLAQKNPSLITFKQQFGLDFK